MVCIYLCSAGFNEFLRRIADGTARVGHVVYEDGHLVEDFSYQHHGGHLASALPFLVDKREVHVEAVRDRRDPLSAARVRRHDHAILPAGDILAYPFVDGRLCQQVVHGNVEEALNLRSVQVHGDDVVGSRHRQHVGHQLGGYRRSALRNQTTIHSSSVIL